MVNFVHKAIPGCAVFGLMACSILAQTPFTVSGKANIYAAGSSTSEGEPPVEIRLPPAVGTEQAVQFTGVAGSVGNGVTTNGPDGRIELGSEGAEVMNKAAGTLIRAEHGLSALAVLHRYTFLTGVFLGSTLPPQTPVGLVFTDEDNADTLSPELGQTFFIGSGITTSGKPRTFRVPEGATRLYLGISDVCDLNKFAPAACYGDNSGSFSGEVLFLTRSCRWIPARETSASLRPASCGGADGCSGRK